MIVLRVLALSIPLGLFISTGFLCQLLPGSRSQRYRRILRFMPFFGSWTLWTLGVQTRLRKPLTSPPLRVLVANHVSYVDVVILATHSPGVFVTSTDVQSAPFLGWMAKAAGCVFVDRRNKKSLMRDLRALEQLLQEGLPINLFPEGTSSDGAQVLPFKNSLLEAACRMGVPVQPLVLNYQISPTMTADTYKSSVFWYGDMPFFSHLFSLLRLKPFQVNLFAGDTIPTQGKNRRAVGDEAHASICGMFSPIV